ncbi:hypothetical protein [Streptomyces nodosus]|uniref:hypothetical protein n=1 Tax=Streptomyces nodosus TaxID=40318 RepID=UPI003818DB8D
MISTRRIVAAVGLAAGVTGLAAPMAAAAPAGTADPGSANPVTVLDSLARSDIPAQHKDEIPRPSRQLEGLNELHRATDLAAPATGLLP